MNVEDQYKEYPSERHKILQAELYMLHKVHERGF